VQKKNELTEQQQCKRRIWVTVLGVVALTVAFRLPSCAESFWLDELHSAWVVNDSMSDVAWRAAQGNQTTLYFRGLWVWSRLVGRGELAMRASSVLASGLAAGCLVVGVRRRSGSLIGGTAAGSALAIDPNAVFFGCELRPYAWLLPCAVIAVWAMMGWWQQTDRRAAWSRVVIVSMVCLAALLHPTSLGVLGLLLAVAAIGAIGRRRDRLSRLDGVSLVVLTGTAAALWWSSLPDSWQQRDLWRAFGQARHWRSFWYAWDYVPLLLLPIGLAALLAIVARMTGPENPLRNDPPGYNKLGTAVGWIPVGLIPGGVAAVGTLVFFVASYFEWIPLWHRRYFIAALPLICWTTGEMVGSCEKSVRSMLDRWWPKNEAGGRSIGTVAAIALAALLLGYQAWDQRTLAVLATGQLPLQWRGENWRGAVARVQRELGPEERVWLDSGLIEASVFALPPRSVGPLASDQLAYLAYPLSGPYRLPRVDVVALREHDARLRRRIDRLPSQAIRVWLISRSGPAAVGRWVGRAAAHRKLSMKPFLPGMPGVYRLDFESDRSNR